MPVMMDSLTERLQRYLGLQQAQSIQSEDISADAIARLMERRGDISALVALWDRVQRKEQVVDYRPLEHEPILDELLRVLDATLVVQRERGSRRPKTFMPLFPEIVPYLRAGTLYRELGRTVVDGLWRSTDRSYPGFLNLLKELVARWPLQHPLARLLQPLCRPLPISSPEGTGNLTSAILADPLLANWVRSVVAQDWVAYLKAAGMLSADEQLDMMNGLIGLHLHVALLYRLRGADAESAAPVFFVAAARSPEEDRTCDRAAYNCFSFWRDRTSQAMRHVAGEIVDQTAASNGELNSAINRGSWVLLNSWSGTEIKEPGKTKRATRDFVDNLKATISDAETKSPAPTPEVARQLVISALYAAFDTLSGPAVKAKDFLRNSGRAAGIVGPEGSYRRKRYQLDDRAIEMLVRLHAVRPSETINSDEDERQSVGAWLDDLAERYGIIITLERERARGCFEKATTASKMMRALRSHFPSEQAMATNREVLDGRMELLRCVRRFSDASSIIWVG
jgi:hypothetical protein